VALPVTTAWSSPASDGINYTVSLLADPQDLTLWPSIYKCKTSIRTVGVQGKFIAV